jgi:hypothetical protein
MGERKKNPDVSLPSALAMPVASMALPYPPLSLISLNHQSAHARKQLSKPFYTMTYSLLIPPLFFFSGNLQKACTGRQTDRVALSTRAIELSPLPYSAQHNVSAPKRGNNRSGKSTFGNTPIFNETIEAKVLASFI